MKHTKKLWTAIIFLMLVTFFLPVPTVHGEGERLEIDIQVGFNGKVKQDRSFPVHIEVTNDQEDFSGDLVLTVPRYGNAVGNLVIPIDIAANSTKTISVVVPTGTSEFNPQYNRVPEQQFALFEGSYEDGKEVSIDPDLSIQPQITSMDQIMIGFLSDRPDAINDVKLARFTGNSPQVVQLTEQDLYSDANAYDTLDVIVIYDTSLLSKDEDAQLAIREWVSKGGILVVGSSFELAQQLGTLSELLAFQVSGEEEISSFEAFEKATREPFTENSFRIYTGDLHEEGKILFQESEKPLVVTRSIDQGAVIQPLYDIGAPALDVWQGIDEWWSALIDGSNLYVSSKGMYFENVLEQFSRIVKEFPNFDQISIGVLVLLFFGYLFLFVPVLYVLLKKMDKREWSWVIIPSLSIVLSLALFGFGAKDRMGDYQVNTASVIQLSEDGWGSGYGGIAFLSQGAGEYEIKLDKQYSPFPSDQVQALNKVPAVKTVNDQSVISYPNVEFWSTRSMTIHHPYQQYGAIQGNLEYKDGKLLGTISNELGLAISEIYLIAGDKIEQLGKLGTDESKEISISIRMDRLFATRTPDMAYRLFPFNSMGQSADEYLERELFRIAFESPQIMQKQNQPYFYAVTKKPIMDIPVNEKKTEQTALNLFIQEVPFSIEQKGAMDVNLTLDIPKIQAEKGEIDFNYLEQGNGQSMIEASAGSYLLNYTLPETFQKVDPSSITISTSPFGGETYEVFSHVTGEYLPFPSNRATFEGEKAMEILSEQGIQIRATLRNGGPASVPSILLKGVARP
ncbi:DUF4350 domain-containing protein [Bacillaceae bacterium S4-13-56]